MLSSRFPIAFSYALDLANFLSVLTGDPFYVRHHKEAYALWGERLSERSREAMASARAARGSAMLGPAISHLVSAIPGFAERDLLWLLTQPESHYEGWQYYQSAWWPKAREIMAHLLPVLEELERLGFREYWTRERLPLIQRAAAEMGEYLARSAPRPTGSWPTPSFRMPSRPKTRSTGTTVRRDFWRRTWSRRWSCTSAKRPV